MKLDELQRIQKHTADTVFCGAQVVYASREGTVSVLRIGEVIAIDSAAMTVVIRASTDREVSRRFFEVGVLM